MSQAGGASPRPGVPNGAQQIELSSSVVRHVLLGLHGPYADPRVALDPLDNVEALTAELDVEGMVELASVLVELALDADAVVATGAILALDVIRRQQAANAKRFRDVVGQMIDLVLASNPPLDRPPEGFGQASQATLRAELAVIAARFASSASVPAVSVLVERAAAVGVARVDLVAALAERLPALVVAQARAWVGATDSAVVARLGEHHRRIAVATAARPWDERAIRAVELAGQWQGWHEAEIEAVLRVMRDDAPELTAPAGIGTVDLGGRWWIVAERPWDWTLWRCDDGRTVLEQVEGGVGVWTSVRVVPDATAAAIIAAEVIGVELTSQQIRNGVGATLASPAVDPGTGGA